MTAPSTHHTAGIVGIVGTGRMGTAFGRRLLQLGHRVVVHNRTQERAGPLLAAGARWAETPGDLVGATDILLTSLYDDDAVRAVYLGSDGLLAAATTGRPVLVEMSTITAATSFGLHKHARVAGATLVDAPVAGGPAQASDGALLVMAGGDPAAVARAGPVLEGLGRTVVHAGAGGSGHVLKLVLMQSLAAYFAGLSEAVTTGARLGLAPPDMMRAFLSSHAAPPALQARAEQLVGELAGRPGPVGFPVEGVLKDIRAELANAELAGAPSGVLSAVRDTFQRAVEDGYAARDLSAVVAATLGRANRRTG